MPLGEARPSVQQEQRRIGEALAPDQHPLIDPAKAEIVDLRDTAANHPAVWTAERSRLSQMLQAVTTLLTNTALRRETRNRALRATSLRTFGGWQPIGECGWPLVGSVAKRLACGLQIVDLLRDTVAAEIEAFSE